ncbi:MAG TPA: hypothetical protein VGD98_03720 [Ktedonobacteraceae bacterium]
MKAHLLRKIVFTVASMLLLILFTACAGVGTNSTGTSFSITGTITQVDSANHSVTLNVSGQQYTINGLTDQEIQALQQHQGQLYTILVTKNTDGTYTITTGTNPTLATNQTPGVSETPGANETPDANETPGANETPNATEAANSTGSITVTGQAQNVVNNSSLTITLPDATSLTITITQATKIDSSVSNGQIVQVDADATSSGFNASGIKHPDNSDDVNKFEFTGKTTRAVGTDNILYVTVGNHSFNYAIGQGAKLDDFSNSVSNINNGTLVKVKVLFNGSKGTITEVSNKNN